MIKGFTRKGTSAIRDLITEATGIDITVLADLPSDQDLEDIAKPHNLVPITAEQLPVVPPPDSFSSLEQIDLKKVIERLTSPITSQALRHVYDKDYLGLFKKFVASKSRSYNEDYITNLSKDLRPLILELKYMYNRPRPSQVASLYGVQLDCLKTPTADSPSYPSGHTIQAYVVAILLAHQLPDLAEDLIYIAELIAQSRIDAGVHFLSDIVFGRMLAAIIAKGILDENFA